MSSLHGSMKCCTGVLGYGRGSALGTGAFSLDYHAKEIKEPSKSFWNTATWCLLHEETKGVGVLL